MGHNSFVEFRRSFISPINIVTENIFIAKRGRHIEAIHILLNTILFKLFYIFFSYIFLTIKYVCYTKEALR